jgi:hypothetical protein
VVQQEPGGDPGPAAAAGASTPSVRDDDRMTRRLAWAGVAGVAVHVVIDVALAFLRPDLAG